MTVKLSQQTPEPGFLRRLRAIALVAALSGAVGSIGFMFHAGRHSPRVLLVLMGLWVLSPFIAFVVADVASKRWAVGTRAALYSGMLALTLGSLAIYGADALRAPHAQAAFVFVAVPPASWLLAALIVLTAASMSGRLARPGDGS
ncbi:MAG: hypothetical protein NVS4B3_05140 [Gemmatimonadaceae bacterium]